MQDHVRGEEEMAHSPASIVHNNTYSDPKLLQRDLGKLVNNSNFADVKFIVGEEEEVFYAHKVILCQRSAYFQAMFLTSGMKER